MRNATLGKGLLYSIRVSLSVPLSQYLDIWVDTLVEDSVLYQCSPGDLRVPGQPVVSVHHDHCRALGSEKLNKIVHLLSILKSHPDLRNTRGVKLHHDG